MLRFFLRGGSSARLAGRRPAAAGGGSVLFCLRGGGRLASRRRGSVRGRGRTAAAGCSRHGLTKSETTPATRSSRELRSSSAISCGPAEPTTSADAPAPSVAAVDAAVPGPMPRSSVAASSGPGRVLDGRGEEAAQAVRCERHAAASACGERRRRMHRARRGRAPTRSTVCAAASGPSSFCTMRPVSPPPMALTAWGGSLGGRREGRGRRAGAARWCE